MKMLDERTDNMAGKKSEFDKVFSAWDILVIAFGAMIGWGGLYQLVTG